MLSVLCGSVSRAFFHMHQHMEKLKLCQLPAESDTSLFLLCVGQAAFHALQDVLLGRIFARQSLQLCCVCSSGCGACHRGLLSPAAAHVSLGLQACPPGQSPGTPSAVSCGTTWCRGSASHHSMVCVTPQFRGVPKNQYQSQELSTHTEPSLKFALMC